MAEDEPDTRHVLVEFLTGKGYRVLEAADGKTALRLALEENPALAMLDVEMPEMGGLEVIERLRERGNAMPVLVLSGRREVGDRVKGLRVGADDYLAKPYDFTELIARIEALLRRSTARSEGIGGLKVGGYEIDLALRTGRSDGASIQLSHTETAILELLARHRGRPVTREKMLDVVWGYTYLPKTRTLDTHIWRLRKKLGDDGAEPRWLKSVSGSGYLLAD